MPVIMAGVCNAGSSVNGASRITHEIWPPFDAHDKRAQGRKLAKTPKKVAFGGLVGDRGAAVLSASLVLAGVPRVLERAPPPAAPRKPELAERPS
jgi:hypothetical protein